jgi:hypothetical protein
MMSAATWNALAALAGMSEEFVRRLRAQPRGLNTV